jgi:TRAP-type mannitol/chloroaromatic compound transport system substrate-binding protein
MRRRDVLASAGSLAAGATLSFSAPAIAQGIRQLKMVTDWPEALPGLHSSAIRFAQTVGAATGERIKIEVFPAGALVRPFETFDAVGAGVADMFHTFEGYFETKSPAFHFFAAIPFGFTADELFAWVQYGGGQELWDTLNGQFNVKSLLCTNTGCQMGGWFTREITSPDGFKGLRYRMGAPPGAEVLRRLGAIVVTLPISDIIPALKSGAIDASEWIGPWTVATCSPRLAHTQMDQRHARSPERGLPPTTQYRGVAEVNERHNNLARSVQRGSALQHILRMQGTGCGRS